MSAFVLSREYELQLPTSYVDIDRAEMEYVDGGAWNSVQNIGYALNNKHFGRMRSMWIIASLYISCNIISIIVYFVGCNKISRYEINKKELLN